MKNQCVIFFNLNVLIKTCKIIWKKGYKVKYKYIKIVINFMKLNNVSFKLILINYYDELEYFILI